MGSSDEVKDDRSADRFFSQAELLAAGYSRGFLRSLPVVEYRGLDNEIVYLVAELLPWLETKP